MIAMIIENFRTGTTGTSGPHRPKIIICGDPDDAVIRQTRMFFPDIHRLFIGVIDRNQKLVAINTEFFGDQIPSKRNSVFFEIIPKTEISEHFKKCMVARGIAHIIEIIMLTTGAHAFLAGCRTTIIAVL